jgi:hypothetical protein
MKRAKQTKLSAPICSADFVMPFGKYRGHTLDRIADHDGQYVLWLHEAGVLRIKKDFRESVEMDDRERESEMRDIINEHVHDIY